MAWMLLIATLVPAKPTPTKVTVAELNHFHNETTGEEILTQWIWWQWEFRVSEGWSYYCVDWRLAKDIPFPVNGVQEWWDKKTKKQVRVESQFIHETWTIYDREKYDRQRLPETQRRKL